MKYAATIVLFLFSCALLSAQDQSKAELLAQAQLDAYNNGDIEKFLLPYSDSVEVYQFPDQLIYRGKELMRKQYAEFFERYPALHCELKSRMVQGNSVIDQEYVTLNEDYSFPAIAIYEIKNDLIQKVWFIQ